MKSMTHACCLLSALCVPAFAAGPAFPEGEILLRHSEGPRTTKIRFVKSTEILRIEQLGESRLPPPINLIDLENGEITLIAPINHSVRTFPADAFDPPKPADTGADWEIPAGLGANPTPPGTPAPRGAGVPPAAYKHEVGRELAGGIPAGVPGTSGQSESPPRIGPDPALLPPGVEIPAIPQMPPLPANGPGTIPPGLPKSLPSGLPGGLAGGMPGSIPGGIPAMPNFPGLPGMDAPTGELVAHEETRKFHGYECQRHTLLLDHNLELTLWLSEHPDLPPFYLLIWDEPPRFGPRDPMREWTGIVRRSRKFPLLAELREAPRPSHFPAPPAPGSEGDARKQEEERPVMATWEVISLTPGKPDSSLFEIPEGYSRIER